MELTISGDFRVMSESAFFMDAPVAIGATPTDRWRVDPSPGNRGSESQGGRLARRGRHHPGGEELGVDVDVVPDGECLDAARGLTKRLRNMPPTALRESTRLVDPATVGSFDEHAHTVLDRRWTCEGDSESKEAAAAMRKGREPEFNWEYSDSEGETRTSAKVG